MSLPMLLRDRDAVAEWATLAAVPASHYIWPTYGYFTQGFRSRFNPQHSGIDIAGSIGTPIRAAAAGVVTYSGFVNSGYNYGLGNMVEIRHSDGTITRYAHTSRLLVREGQQVAQGELIALMGSTGNSTGPHLHFEVQRSGGGFLDPLQYLPPLAQPIAIGVEIPQQGQPNEAIATRGSAPLPSGRRQDVPPELFAAQYRWPTNSRQIIAGYITAPERQHLGIDIAGTLGTPVRAAAAGEVVFAGDRGDLRQAVTLRHADGSMTTYANNQQIAVRVGDRVRQGDAIATLGNRDPQQPPHLHFEIRSANGSPLNPYTLLPR